MFNENQFNSTERSEERLAFYQQIIDDYIKKTQAGGSAIGEGKTAEILILEEDDATCLKVLKNKKISCNRVEVEMDFLDKLSDPQFLKSIGIDFQIVPLPKYSKQTVNYDFLFLERISGFSIKDLLEKDLVDNLPKNFSLTNFFQKLENIVSKLNSAKIYHRDLHFGNVMINDLGHPIIIDFGDATECFLTDEDPYKDILGSRVVNYTSDKNNLAKIKNDFENYLKQK